MTESPYTVLPVADGAYGVAPLRWRVGRSFAIGFSVAGVACALAGHITGLLPAQTAGGECFGGGLLILSGLLLCILLWSQRKRLPVDCRLWAVASASLVLLGALFFASGYSKTQKDRSAHRKLRANLDVLKDAVDAYHQSSTERDY